MNCILGVSWFAFSNAERNVFSMTKSCPVSAVRRWLPDLLLWAFAAVLVVFAAQFIGNRNFWLDEYYSIHLVELDWADIPDFAAGDVHPPLYYFILKCFVSLLGTAHAVYRVASFAAYLLTVGMALVLFRPAFGRLATFFFLCLMGPNATSLHYFTEVRMYGWALFFVLLCGFSGYRLLDEDCPHRRRWWVALAVSGLIAGYLHYYALLAVGLIYLMLLLYSIARRPALLRNWGIAVGLSVLCYLPWALLTATRLSRQVSTFWLQELPTLGETLELIVGNRLSSWLVLALFAAGCLVFLFWPRGKATARRWLVATGLVVAVGLPVAGYAASVLLRPMYLPRYFLPAVGLLWLAMAVAASGLLHRFPLLVGVCGSVLLAALVLFAMEEPAMLRLKEMNECNEVITQALAYVQDRYQPGDKVYSAVDLVDQRVLDFLLPAQNTEAGTDPASALPEEGGSLFLIYAEEDPSGDWAAALEQAGLQMDGWQGALLDNTWCRIYYYVPTNT